MPTPTKVLIIQSFQDPAGNPLAGGKATFSLSIDISTGASSGPQVAAGRTVTATLDNTGTCFVQLWPNDTLSPPGSVYFVAAYTAQGQPAWRGELTVSATGSPNYILLEDGSLILLEPGGPLDGILLES